MKVGAIDWCQEQSILTALRKEFTPDELELRVDANGAFELEQAIEVSKFLSELEVHSMEQPCALGAIRSWHWQQSRCIFQLL